MTIQFKAKGHMNERNYWVRILHSPVVDDNESYYAELHTVESPAMMLEHFRAKSPMECLTSIKTYLKMLKGMTITEILGKSTILEPRAKVQEAIDSLTKYGLLGR